MSDYNMTKSCDDYNFNRPIGTSTATTTIMPNESSTINIEDYNWKIQGSNVSTYLFSNVPIYDNTVIIIKSKISSILEVLLYKKKTLEDNKTYHYDLSLGIDDAMFFHNERMLLSWYIKNFSEYQNLYFGYMFYKNSLIAEIYNYNLSMSENKKELYKSFVNPENPKLIRTLETICKK